MITGARTWRRATSNSSTSASTRVRSRSAIVRSGAPGETVSPGCTCRVITCPLSGDVIRILARRAARRSTVARAASRRARAASRSFIIRSRLWSEMTSAVARREFRSTSDSANCSAASAAATCARASARAARSSWQSSSSSNSPLRTRVPSSTGSCAIRPPTSALMVTDPPGYVASRPSARMDPASGAAPAGVPVSAGSAFSAALPIHAKTAVSRRPSVIKPMRRMSTSNRAYGAHQPQ